METKTLEKVLDVAGSAAKVAANLSEVKKPEPTGDNDNSNKASTGSQNIQIHMDSGKKKDPKPVEKHIHTFPETRALTSLECDLEMKRIEMEHEIEKAKLKHQIEVDNREWQHQLEVEKANEKKGKIRKIVGGILIAIGVVSVGYNFYKDHKAIPEAKPIETEGTVK